MWEKENPEELRLLKLLGEFQQLLADALNSLSGKEPKPTPENQYLSWMATAINRAADGYLFVRSSGRVDASKLLIRPILEALFFGAAVMNQKGFLYQKAFAEKGEDMRLVSSGKVTKPAIEQALAGYRAIVQKQEPRYPFKHEAATAREAARIAGMLPVYDRAYRIYCHYTHGALNAVAGEFDEMTDSLDTSIVLWSVFLMLEFMKTHTPATVPDLGPLRAKLPNF